MVPKRFQLNDLVWAKMRYWPYWPAKIVNPPTEGKPKKYHYYVFFFGTYDYAWIHVENIKSHSEDTLENFGEKKKSINFLKGVEEIIQSSKEVSNYHRSDESSVSDKNTSEIKEENYEIKKENCQIKEENSNFDVNSENENHQPNSILKRKRKLSSSKDFPITKPSIKKPGRKCIRFSDQIEPNNRLRSATLNADAELVPHVPPRKVLPIKKPSIKKTGRKRTRLSAQIETNNHLRSAKLNYDDADTQLVEHVPPRKVLPIKKPSIKKTGRKQTSFSDQIEPNKCLRSVKLNYDDAGAELVSPNPNSGNVTAPLLNILDRKYFERPDTPPIDLTCRNESLKDKKIKPTNKKIGFLGVNQTSQGILKDLCQSGHSLIIWNQTPSECAVFAEKFNNVEVACTPGDVIEAAHITFSCASDSDMVQQIVYGNCGILKELERHGGQNKGYIEMTSMEPVLSRSIADAIKINGCRYLEAPLCGSRLGANDGTLNIIAAGDETLYDDSKSCFDAIAKKHRFIDSGIGRAFNVGLTRNMLEATVYAAIAESLALVQKYGYDGDIFIDLLKDGPINNKDLVEKAKLMVNNEFISNTTLKRVQQDFNIGLSLGDKVSQPTPVLATVREVYKDCKSMVICAALKGSES